VPVAHGATQLLQIFIFLQLLQLPPTSFWCSLNPCTCINPVYPTPTSLSFLTFWVPGKDFSRYTVLFHTFDMTPPTQSFLFLNVLQFTHSCLSSNFLISYFIFPFNSKNLSCAICGVLLLDFSCLWQSLARFMYLKTELAWPALHSTSFSFWLISYFSICCSIYRKLNLLCLVLSWFSCHCLLQ